MQQSSGFPAKSRVHYEVGRGRKDSGWMAFNASLRDWEGPQSVSYAEEVAVSPPLRPNTKALCQGLTEQEWHNTKHWETQKLHISFLLFDVTEHQFIPTR